MSDMADISAWLRTTLEQVLADEQADYEHQVVLAKGGYCETCDVTRAHLAILDFYDTMIIDHGEQSIEHDAATVEDGKYSRRAAEALGAGIVLNLQTQALDRVIWYLAYAYRHREGYRAEWAGG